MSSPRSGISVAAVVARHPDEHVVGADVLVAREVLGPAARRGGDADSGECVRRFDHRVVRTPLLE